MSPVRIAAEKLMHFAVHRHHCQVLVSGECSCGMKQAVLDFDAAVGQVEQKESAKPCSPSKPTE